MGILLFWLRQELWQLLRCLAISVFALVIAALVGCVRIPQERLTLPIEKDELSDHVHFLAQPALKGRKPKTSGSRHARRYIESRFKAFGLTPWGATKTYAQPFGVGTNIIGVLPGSDEQLADRIVLVSAHFDHVGIDKNGKAHLGASDNASGVAALLEIAERLSLSENRPKRTICFAAFDCEEKFLLGAFAFTCREDFAREKLDAVINIDMLGRDFFDVVENSLFVVGTENYPALRKVVSNAAIEARLRVLPIGTDLVGPRGDHVVFEPFEIPCLFFSCGQHGDYHKPTDTPEKLDYSTMQRQTEVIFQTIEELANADEIALRITGETEDAQELLAIKTVLTEVGEQWRKAGLTDQQHESIEKLLNRAEELTGRQNYTQRNRRKFVWNIQTFFIDMATGDSLEGKDDKKNPKKEDLAMLLVRAVLMDHRANAIESIRQCFKQAMTHKPRLFAGPIKSSSDVYGTFGDVRFEPAEQDKYIFATVFALCHTGITMEATLVPPYTKGQFNFGVMLRSLGMVGTKEEVVDCILSFWNSKENLSQASSKVLELVTGEHDKKTYDEWLRYRLGQSGKEDEKQWVLELLDSDNGPLVRQAIWAGLRIAPEQFFEKLPAIAANPNLPPDVRANAIRLTPVPVTKEMLHLLWLVNLLDEEVKVERPNIRNLLAPSHPLHDSTELSAAWNLINGKTKENQAAPKTLADKAQAKLKELTGQDFGKDAAAWRKWIESTLTEKPQWF